MTTAPKLCITCGRDPAKVNSRIAQCSHVDCPCRGPALVDWPLPTLVDQLIGVSPADGTREMRSLFDNPEV